MTTLATFAVTIAGALVACGGDDNSSAPPSDAGADGTILSEPDGGGGTPVIDGGGGTDGASSGEDGSANETDGAATDGGPSEGDDGGDAGSCTVGAACSANGQSGGLCSDGTCSACTPITDDATCNSVYGSTGNPYICESGQCAPGNCHADADCTAGQICGISTANICGGCTSDAQCQADANYAGDVCNASGACVSAACTSSSSVPKTKTTCTQATADICCSNTAGSTTGTCTAGNCCSASDCSTGQTCTNNTCTSCAAVTTPITGPTVYYVDPLNGSDTGATGSGKTMANVSASACSFQTVTRALEFIGTATGATTIQLTGSGTALASSEKYPIQLPKNVTLAGTASTATPPVPTFTATLPAGKSGFALDAASSGITDLIIDGAGAGTYGIEVGSGANAALSNVAIKNTLQSGIRVANSNNATTGGTLTINAGTTVTASGTTSARASGLSVSGNGVVVINGTAGNPVQFNGNTEHGIDILGSSSITINGALGASPPSSATVQALGNYAAGLDFSQTPGATPAAAQSVVTGIASGNTTNGNGIRISAGSNVKLRSSWALGSSGSGVLVATYTGTGGATSSDVSLIDLGTGTSYGLNIFQATTSANAGAGLCLALDGKAAMTLNATGNTFVTGATPPASLDCSTTAGTLTKSTSGCSGGADIGFGGTNAISVSQCTP